MRLRHLTHTKEEEISNLMHILILIVNQLLRTANHRWNHFRMNLEKRKWTEIVVLFVYHETLMLKDWKTIVDKHAVIYKRLWTCTFLLWSVMNSKGLVFICINSTSSSKISALYIQPLRLFSFLNADRFKCSFVTISNFFIPRWIIKISDIYKITR